MRKQLKFVKTIITEEAIKDYKPQMITNVVCKEIKWSYDNSDIEYLKTQEVFNIKHKLSAEIAALFSER